MRETREVRRNGVLQANPTNEVSRGNGTFASSPPITPAPDGTPGTCEVTTIVSFGDRSTHGGSTFIVD